MGRAFFKGVRVLRAGLLFVCVMAPFVIAAIMSAASAKSVLIVLIVVAVNFAFWSLLSLFVTARVEAGPTAAALLLRRLVRPGCGIAGRWQADSGEYRRQRQRGRTSSYATRSRQ